MTPSVMVLSDDRLFADALERTLARQDLRVIAASGGEEQPDVVVLDPGAVPLQLALARTALLREMLTGSQIIVLGVEHEEERVLDFIEAGASGYVQKSAPPADLVVTIRAVYKGEVSCSPRMATLALERIARLSVERVPFSAQTRVSLTERELEILALLADGLQNKEIGRCLRITVQTVKNHVHSILDKLGVHSRRKAVRLGYELGLLREKRDPVRPP